MFIISIVDDRKISQVFDNNIYIKIGKAYPRMVDEKVCIITVINLKDEILVYNISAEFKDFPILINYRIIKSSSYYDYCKYQNFKLRISIGNIEIDDICTLDALFKVKN